MEEIKQKYNGFVENVRQYGDFPEVLEKHTWEFISDLLKKRDETIIKMLENTDVQMSVNGDVSKDEIAMAKFIYKAHIKHIIKTFQL